MKARVLIFWDSSFAQIDSMPVDPTLLIETMPPMESVRTVDTGDLKRLLRRESVDLLINPYGSAFPKDAWDEIFAFLSAGGSLLNLGGEPFSVPVSGGAAEERQDTYQRLLGIDGSEEADLSAANRFDCISTEPLLSGLMEHFTCERVWRLKMRLTKDGGASRTVLHPLSYAVGRAESKVAAPIVALDHVRGDFAGGRWVLANYSSDIPINREMAHKLTGFAALGAIDFQIRPSFACYFTDERASMVVHLNRFSEHGEAAELNLSLVIKKENTIINTDAVELRKVSSPFYESVPLIIPLTPGIYSVEARMMVDDEDLSDKFGPCYKTGFWCCDKSGGASVQPLSAVGDNFMRGDKPSFVLGTAYSPCDGDTDFLLEPNVSVWDEDFARIRDAKANTVRIGLRGGFRRAMFHSGVPSEEIVRAFTAFMLTAAKNDLGVIFTLFDGVPESWGGADPLSDRVSVQAQKEFAAALARRHLRFNNLMWDLLDRPQNDPAGWADEIAGVIRQGGNRNHLVGAGADAGPDFSTVHTNLGDGPFDYILNRSSGRPTLFAESYGGSVDELGALRNKLAASVGAGGAGVLERFTELGGEGTPGMGFFGADGVSRPSLDVYAGFADFIRQARPYFLDKTPEDVCIVLPDGGDAAARVCVKIFHEIGIPARVVKETAVEKGLCQPMLIAVPSVERLSDAAWEKIDKAVKNGALLYVSGPFPDRLSALGFEVEKESASPNEKAVIYGTEYALSFKGDVQKGSVDGNSSTLKTEFLESGKVVYAPLPFEMAENLEPAAELYKFVLRQADLQPMFFADGVKDVLIRPQIFKNAILYAVISSADEDVRVDFTDALTSSSHSMDVPARGSALLLINRSDGSRIAEF